MKVPAWVNVCLKLWPEASWPESNAPSSEVIVWAVESLFVKVTSVPTATSIEEGLKEKFSAETELCETGDELITEEELPI